MAAPENEPIVSSGVSDTPLEQRIEDPSELKHLEDKAQELEGYLQKIERVPSNQLVLDDATNQPLLTPSQAQSVTITLPLTEEEIKKGIHHKILDGMRWLAEWCLRIAKKAALTGVKVIYRK